MSAWKGKVEMSARKPPPIYAVIGRPVGRSLSPQMHNAAFKRLGLDAAYVRLASETSRGAVKTLKRMGARGFNVTLPYKEEMLELVDDLDGEAERIGAINTVCSKKGKLIGCNTDAYGAVQALMANSVVIDGESILVIGAGGAARAAVHGLLGAGASVTVANRTVAKAKVVARDFGCSSSSLAKNEIEKAVASCAVIVSCANSPDAIVPRGALRKGMAVLDADYRCETGLARDARKAGCVAIDGREWLLFQGAKAFELFTCEDAPLGAMRKAVYADNGAKRGKGVSLMGFMGSGKSVVAKALAKRLKLHAIDTDSDIESESGMTINEIFGKSGEAGFRELERMRISRLSGSKPAVVATGGGSVLEKENVKALRANGTVALLWVGEETLSKRLACKKDRPLLSGCGKIMDPVELEKLLRERTPIYLKSADIVVDAEASKAKIAEVIAFEAREAR